jgi:Zn-dependent peptidase ImmA (M78 family)
MSRNSSTAGERMPIRGIATGREVAQALLQNDAELSDQFGPEHIEHRLRRLGELLSVHLTPVRSFSSVRGSFHEKHSSDLFLKSSAVAEAPELPMRRYIAAHELGHAALRHLRPEEKASEPEHQIFRNQLEREAFCQEFASELLLPKAFIERLAYVDFESPLSESEARMAQAIRSASGPKLTFYHMAAIARKLGVPMVVLLTNLRNHRVLSEAESAFSIFRMSTNRFTSRELGLRAWINVCPRWGFLPPNRRVARLGFSHAESAITNGRHGEGLLHGESLLVQHRNPDKCAQTPKWIRHVLNTQCSYTPIDRRERGRFLFVCWHWSELTG